MRIKNEILKNSSATRHSVVGGPGTGKSIILFDLAVKYKKLGKKVLVIFSGKLPEARRITTLLGIDVISIMNIVSVSIENYDIICIDETQRLYPIAFRKVNEFRPEKLIYFIDHSQVLHPTEKNLNIENQLYEDSTVINHKLKYKIRTDKNMAAFIKKFLNRNTRNANVESIDNVSVNYFCTQEQLKEHVKYMVNNYDFVSIELTEYITKSTYALKRKQISPYSKSVHDVVGREFSNVIVVIDNYFKYDSNGNLCSTYGEYYPFLTENCIFESLTRVKENLNIVILNNNEIYTHVKKMINEGF